MSRDPALDASIDVKTLSDDEWRELLSPMEHAILRKSSTERPGSGRYLKEEGAGAYHCAGCGQKLYTGAAKFHSGCGWPSFFQEAEEGVLEIYRDVTHGMARTEMRCGRCDGHLGHIFEDAPQTPTGNRHCVNGFALLFVPEGKDLDAVLTTHRASKD
jgi:peptide-methionine (R)-S-oxide reductase